MGVKTYDRPSAAVQRSRRWPALRLAAKRRDGFRCVECGARAALEVDHIEPVRRAPERAFDLSNLQTLCIRCHSRKTRIEIGLGEENPARDAWKQAVAELARPNGRK